MKLLLTVPEVAEALGLGSTKVYELIRRGELESLSIGRTRRVPVEALDAFVARLREDSLIGLTSAYESFTHGHAG